MVKKHTTLNIEYELVEKAKEKFLNMSAIAEDAIRERLNLVKVHIDETIKECEFCGKEGEKKTRETVNQKKNGLTWLFPDERWICNECLKGKSRKTLK